MKRSGNDSSGVWIGGVQEMILGGERERERERERESKEMEWEGRRKKKKKKKNGWHVESPLWMDPPEVLD